MEEALVAAAIAAGPARAPLSVGPAGGRARHEAERVFVSETPEIGGLLLIGIVAHAAAQFADPGYEANLMYRRLVGAGPWKEVAADFGDLTFGFLRCGVDFLAKRPAVFVL